MWTREARGTDQKDLQWCSTVRLTLPVGDERTGWNVQGRVAVLRTLPLGGERAGRHVQGRVAVLAEADSEPAAVAPTSRHPGLGVTWTLPLPGDDPSRGVSLQTGRFLDWPG